LLVHRPSARIIAALLPAIAALAATAPVASAAQNTVANNAGTLTFTSNEQLGGAEQNSIVVTEETTAYTVEDIVGNIINPLGAGVPECQPVPFPGPPTNKVSCQKAGVNAFAINLGGMNDQLTFSGWNNALPISVNGGAGSDELKAPLTGTSAITFTGGADPDSFKGGPTAKDTVSYSSASAGVGAKINDTNNSGVGCYGTGAVCEGDSLDASIDNITGGDFSDRLIGSAGPNTLDAGDGDNIVIGGLGDDNLSAGSGADTVSYSDHGTSVEVDLTLGAQDVDPRGDVTETDTLSGFENVTGGSGNDTLHGDVTLGNALDGGPGDDTLDAEDIPDTLLDDPSDTFIGGPGVDIVDYSKRASTANGDAQTLSLDDAANDGVSGEADNIGPDGSVENVIGSAARDTFSGPAASNGFDGAGGVDTVSYAARAADHPVIASLGSGQGGENGETDTYVNVENLTGGAGNDVLSGSDGVNSLSGAAGNDVLDGGLGGDTLDGGADVDTVTYATRTNGVSVTPYAGADDGEAGEADNVKQNVEKVIGGTGDDTMTALGVPDFFFFGGPGNDELTGSSGNDSLDGGSGDDTLSGGQGDDLLAPGTGADTVAGNANTAVGDTISYAGRSDALTIDLGAAGPTNGGAQDGAAGARDTIASAENIVGGDGDDTLTGDDGVNVITGGLGKDTVTAKGGDDSVQIRDDIADTSNCGDGNDTVVSDQIDVVDANCETVDAGTAPALSIDLVRVNEGNAGPTPATLTVTMSKPTSKVVTVQFQTGGGSATAGQDYVAASGTLTFDPGQTSKTLGFTVNGDTAFEGDEPFLVGLSAPTNATLATPVGGVIIVNDDAKPVPPPVVKTCVVPKLVKHTLAYAKKTLPKKNCKLGKTTRRYSSTIKKGRISKISPKAGTKLASGAKVNVVVSKGKKPKAKTKK